MEKLNLENGVQSKSFKHSTGLNLIEQIEVFINTVNHALIGITTFYISWYSFHVGFHEYQTYHAWFTTIAYQLFMSEGILALYNKNTYTMSINKKTYKIRIHWVLMSIAYGFAFYGMFFQIYKRQVTGRTHFHSSHGLTGI